MKSANESRVQAAGQNPETAPAMRSVSGSVPRSQTLGARHKPSRCIELDCDKTARVGRCARLRAFTLTSSAFSLKCWISRGP
jgi:hypothetical protein